MLAATPAHIIKCAGKAGECLCKMGVFKFADILLLCAEKAIYTRYNIVFNVGLTAYWMGSAVSTTTVMLNIP